MANQIQMTPNEIVNSRAVHTAMQASVKAGGLECSKTLYASAFRFNEEFFGGMLTALLVEITAPASPAAYATHQPRTPEGVECVIRIAPDVVRSGDLFANDVLLHEMIHVWQHETENSEPGYAGHGPKFASKCNEIGAKLGLGPVSAKGKGGLPDCKHWPLNVRPAGYYGESPKSAKAVKRATKAKGQANRSPAATAFEQVLRLLPQLSASELEAVSAVTRQPTE